MQMADEEITNYIESLKQIYCQDGNQALDGRYPLKQMIGVAKATITGRKFKVDRSKQFISKRFARISTIREELLNIDQYAQLRNKHNVFVKNAQSLAQEHINATAMNNLNNKINTTVLPMMRKIRRYDREYRELQERILRLTELSNFYKTAKEELEELEELLNSS